MARPTVVFYNNSAEGRAITRNICFIGLQDASVLQDLLASRLRHCSLFICDSVFQT